MKGIIKARLGVILIFVIIIIIVIIAV